MKQNFPFSILFFLILLTGCKKDFSKITTSEWHPTITAPFIQTEMTLRNLIGNDSLLQADEDSLLVYYYQRDSVVYFTPDSLIETRDTATSSSFSLGDLMIGDITENVEVTLNDLLPNLPSEVADSLMANDGKFNIFPAFQLESAVTVELPPVNLFETITFSDGYFALQINNQLPVHLTNISIDILDVINNYIIGSLFINNLDSGNIVYDTVFLQGKTLSNEFAYRINHIESKGSYPDSVLINLSKGLAIQLNGQEMRVVRGVAKFESQILYSDNKVVDIDFGDARIREIVLSGGVLQYQFQSYLNLSANIVLRLPTAEKGGKIPENSFNLSPNGFYDVSWNLANMSVDLSTDPEQPYNKMPVFLELEIEQTTGLVQFDSADQVSVDLSVHNLTLAAASGNFGTQSGTINEDTINLDLNYFKNIEGEIIIDDPVFTLSYFNNFGIPMVVHTNFYGKNTSTDETVNLGIDSLVINYPDTEGHSVNESFIFNKTNSNIVEFLALMPDILVFSGDYLTNWNGDTSNFFTEYSSLLVNSEIRIPLVFKSSSLVFTDTLDFLQESIGDPVESGALQLNVVNGLPFNFDVRLQVPDSITGEIVDYVDFGEIQSANIDINGKVSAPVSSVVTVVLNNMFLQNLKRANVLILSAKTITAAGGNVPVGLYADYTLSVAVSFQARLSP